MIGPSTIRGAVIVLAVWVALGLLRYKPWQSDGAPGTIAAGASARGRETLQVGFLPVT
jgi:hypothetical protein